jgi:hypothetical protein
MTIRHAPRGSPTRMMHTSVYRGRLEYPELRRKVIGLATEHHATTVLIENAGPGMNLLQDLRAAMPQGMTRPIGVKPEGSKAIEWRPSRRSVFLTWSVTRGLPWAFKRPPLFWAAQQPLYRARDGRNLTYSRSSNRVRGIGNQRRFRSLSFLNRSNVDLEGWYSQWSQSITSDKN